MIGNHRARSALILLFTEPYATSPSEDLSSGACLVESSFESFELATEFPIIELVFNTILIWEFTVLDMVQNRSSRPRFYNGPHDGSHRAYPPTLSPYIYLTWGV